MAKGFLFTLNGYWIKEEFIKKRLTVFAGIFPKDSQQCNL
jgi:hypothetical protein